MENLLQKDGFVSIHNRNFQVLVTDMKGIFEPRAEHPHDLRCISQFSAPYVSTVFHGIKSISFLVPKIWSLLQETFKNIDSFENFKILIRDDTHMTSLKIIQFSRPPTPLSICVLNSSTPLTLDVRFQRNSPKSIVKCLLFRIIQFLVLILQSICFICTSWKHKQIMEEQPHRACEETKSKQKQNQVTSHSNWSRVLLFDLAHKQYNAFIKGWLHCLTWDSKGRFLINNILTFGSTWCLVMVQLQFSLIKKLKDLTSRTLANLHPLLSKTSHFCRPSSKWTSYEYYLLRSGKT